MQSSRGLMPQNGTSPTQDAFERDCEQARQIVQEAASGLYGLLQHQHQRQHQQTLPPVGLFVVGKTHPPPHPNTSSTKRKRVDFVDLTSDSDSPREKRPHLCPPRSAPPQPLPTKRKQLAGAPRKKQQTEQEAQVKTDEQLARELQEAEVRKSKAQRLRSKAERSEKRGEQQPVKKLSVYEEFQKIQQEAARDEPTQTRKRTLWSTSPEKYTKRARRGNTPEQRRVSKNTHRILRSSSPEKQPQKKLSVYEEFQKIEREASQQERPSKKLSVYEEFQKIQREAEQGEPTQTRTRTLRSASPEKSTKRSRRGRTPEERRASKQTARVDMDRANTDELNALQKQFQVQPRATTSAESDRHKMPPPPPPKNATGHPMIPSQHFSGQVIPEQTWPQPIDLSAPFNPFNPSRPRSSNEYVPSQHINGPRATQSKPSTAFLPNNAIGHPMVPFQPISGPVIPEQTQPRPFSPFAPFTPLNVSRPYPSNENVPYQNFSGPPILKETQYKNAAYQNLSGLAIAGETQPRPFSPFAALNPSNAEKPRPSNETLLHKSQNIRVTKQSYHTAHKLPYSTQDTQRRAQLHEAGLRAQEHVRKQRQEKEDYIFMQTRHREALQNGVQMVEVENNDVPLKMCEYFASADYRYDPLPNTNPDVAIPSVENFVDLTDEENRAGSNAGYGDNGGYSDHGAANDAVGPSNAIDLANEPRNERALTPLFDTPVSHDRFLNEYELPAIMPDELAPIAPYVGEAGLFLEPEWKEDESCWRAPNPGMTQERAIVEEIIHSVKYINETPDYDQPKE
ncbi:hypothetical protein P171DRAFT_518110 [Karstenula rhodostoma CBS 690.94]|uniref:Uncharacterized protein n=1 Tax=Karstenula rhodostoma CBS 690.94 TaxID=1392251 RepID=A0A9P4PQM8_9PLEO|nr:hypothetical protein P171DRAFT_518110 [Karstenula rhodostoma CBS 690.94]